MTSNVDATFRRSIKVIKRIRPGKCVYPAWSYPRIRGMDIYIYIFLKNSETALLLVEAGWKSWTGATRLSPSCGRLNNDKLIKRAWSEDVDQFLRYNSTCFITIAVRKGLVLEENWNDNHLYGLVAVENNFYYIVPYMQNENRREY